MNAILFPGQGSQIVGMGSEFHDNFEIVKKIFKEADDQLNYKISQIGKIIKKIYPKINISFSQKNKDNRNYKVSSKKIEKILKFKPNVTVKAGLKQLVNYTKKNRIKNIKKKVFQNILNADKF